MLYAILTFFVSLFYALLLDMVGLTSRNILWWILGFAGIYLWFSNTSLVFD